MSDIIFFDDVKPSVLSVNSSNELVYGEKNKKPEIVCKNLSLDFDAVAEEDGSVTAAAVTLNGSLLILRMNDGKWKKHTIFDSRSGTKKISSLKMLKINSCLHVFYCIFHDGAMMLTHHIFDGNGNFFNPQVVAYVGLRCAYAVCADDCGNIHILYADEQNRLKYTMFVNSQKRYAAKDCAEEKDVRSVNCVFADDSVFAVCLSHEREYAVIDCIRTDIAQKHVIGFGMEHIGEPYVFADEEKIYVQWCEKGTCFECCANFGDKFKKATAAGTNFKEVRVRSKNNSSLLGINKCAANASGEISPSAKKACEIHFLQKDNDFRIKGAVAETFAKENSEKFFEKYKDAKTDERIYRLEQRLETVEKYLGEIKMQNTKKKSDSNAVGSERASNKIGTVESGEMNDE